MNGENDSIFKIHEFVAHSTEINCLSFGPKSRQVLATGGNDFKVNVWQVGNASNIWTLGQNKSPVECLCFDAEEQYVVSGAMNGSIKVFDLNEGRLARNLSGHQVNTCSIQYHPYGEFIVSGSVDCSMKVWDVRNKSCIQTYSGHKKEVTCVRFSPDGRWIASSGKDSQLLIWDLVAGKLLSTIRVEPAYVTSFEFNPVDFIIAAVTSTRNVRLWDLDTMEALSNTPSDSSPIRTMAFSPDGNSIYTATKDSLKVFAWEPTAKIKASVEVGWDKVAEVRVSADGTTLTAGSFNSNFVSVWSVDLDKVSNPVAGSKRQVQQPQQQRNGLRSKAVPSDVSSNARYKERNSVDDSDYQADVKSFEKMSIAPSITSAIADSKEQQESQPAVQWASDEARDDMASSMSVSLQRRMREMQTQDQVIRRGSDAKSSERRNGEAGHKIDTPSSVEQMQSLLPPSRYIQSPPPSTASASSGVSDVGMRKDKPNSDHSSSSSSSSAYDRDCKPHLLPAPDSRPPRTASSSNGNGNGNGTPLVGLGLKGHVPLKGPPRPVPSDPRDRDGRDYMSYADIDGGQNALEIRGLNARNNAVSSSAVPVPVPAIDLKVGRDRDRDREDPSLRAAAKRAAVAAATAGSGSGSGSGGGGGASRIEERVPIRSSSDREEMGRISESSRKDDEADAMLDKILRTCGSEAASMSLRLSSVRIMRRLWIKGDLEDVLEHLESLSQGAVHDPSQLVLVADLFSFIELKGSNFTLQSCLRFMTLLDAMISTNERLNMGVVVCAVLKGYLELCGGFGEIIRSSNAMQMAGGGGVDLNREERLRKCHACHTLLHKLNIKFGRMRSIHRTDYKLLDFLDRLVPLVERIL